MLKRKRDSSGEISNKRRSQAHERDSSPERDQPRNRDPSPELGVSTPPPANTPAYSNLKRGELEELLRHRGLTPQLHRRRNKQDYVQRLIEFDQQHPSSPFARNTGQFSPRTTQRELQQALKLRGLSRGRARNRKKSDLLRRLRESEQVHTNEVQTAVEPAKEASPNEDTGGEQEGEASKEEHVAETDDDADGGADDGADDDGDDISMGNSVASSPPTLRQPARWMERTPSPSKVQSDTGSDHSTASSPSGSLPAGADSVTDSSETNADSDKDEDEEESKANPVDVMRTPSPTPPYLPPSAQPERVPVISQSSPGPVQAPASQPLLRSPKQSGKASFPSASQPASTLPRRPPADFKGLPYPGLRLKDLLKQASAETLPAHQTAPPRQPSGSKNKLPDALLQDEDDTSDSSTSDEDP